MARVNTYLNFARETEAAFLFYREAFRTEFAGPMMRFGDIPADGGEGDDGPQIPEADRNLIMNVQLPIAGGHVLMGTDAPESMGFSLVRGNNVHISVETDGRAEADRLFAALADGGEVTMPMADQFWGYYGALTDRFGVRWMVNCPAPE
ncbi:MAG: VOC family protein [Chloroflexota bacterium]